MQATLSRFVSKWAIGAFALALVFYCSSIAFVRADLIELLIYFSYSLVGYFAAGSFIRRCLLLKTDTFSTIALSWCFGFALSILIYLIFFPIGWYAGLKWLPMFLGVLEIGLILKSGKPKLNFDQWQDFKVLLFTGSIVLVSVVLLMPLQNPTVAFGGTGTYYQDFLWHIANSSAFERSFPPDSPQFAGWPYRYHYFNVLQLAKVKSITGIHGFDQTFYCAPLIHAIVMVSAFLALGRRFIRNPLFFLFPLAILFFNCASMWTAAENGHGHFVNVNFYHLITNVNAQGTAIAIASLIGVLVFRPNHKLSWNYTLAGLILFFVLTGVKGPVASLVIAALALTVFFELLTRQFDWQRLLLLIACCGVFAISYELLLSDRVSTSANLYPGKMVRASVLNALLPAYEILNREIILFSILLIPVHFVLYHPIISVAFLVAVVGSLKLVFKLEAAQIYVLGFALAGFAFAYLVDQSPGNSQVYFMMSATPFALLVAWRSWIDGQPLNALYKWLLIGLAVISMLTSVGIYSHALGDARKKLSLGTEEGVPLPKHNGINQNEYDAMVWLRNHSAVDAVFASDRIMKNPDDPRYFYFTAFSSRTAFIAGYFYDKNAGLPSGQLLERRKVNARFFDPHFADRAALMADNGVKYLVDSRFVGEEAFENNLSGLKIVFENRDIKIYVVE